MRSTGWVIMVVAAACLATPAMAADDECCFSNPRYTGVCKVQPDDDETCADVLAYLNNVNSVGKAYCGNTIIRGGWSQVDCNEGGEGATCSVETTVPALAVPDASPSPRAP
jgi:hypothetical protein